MASERAKEMAQRYASVRERTSRPDLDLATRRDIDESLHSLAREPERVRFAEVDADRVPALWCIPEGSDAEHVLLHCHAGGTVVFSMHSDRKAAGHIAVELAKRAEAAGVDVSLRSVRAGQHSFIMGAGRVPEVDQAIQEMGRWLRSRLGLAASAV